MLVKSVDILNQTITTHDEQYRNGNGVRRENVQTEPREADRPEGVDRGGAAGQLRGIGRGDTGGARGVEGARVTVGRGGRGRGGRRQSDPTPGQM